MFNILAVLGITALIKPMLTGGIDVVNLAVMVAVVVLTIPVMARGRTLSRPVGAVMVVLYLAWVVMVVMRNNGAVPG